MKWRNHPLKVFKEILKKEDQESECSEEGNQELFTDRKEN